MLGGRSDRARKELEEDLALVRSVPVSGNHVSPKSLSSEALTLAALARNLEPDLAELTARRIGWLPSIARSPWLIPEDLPAEAWTVRVISSMNSDATKFGIDHTRIPAIGWIMRHHSASTMTCQRQVGKLGDAHRIADQLVALAERLTRSYPRSSHRLHAS